MEKGLMTKPSKELATWDPFREFRSPLFGMLDDWFVPKSSTLSLLEPAKAWAPRIDVAETEKEYVLTAALPGVKKEETKVEVKDGILTVSGEHQAEKEEKGKTFLRREMTYGAFHRCLALPDGVHPEDVHASFKDGLLTVTVRKPAEAKNRGVSVKID